MVSLQCLHFVATDMISSPQYGQFFLDDGPVTSTNSLNFSSSVIWAAVPLAFHVIDEKEKALAFCTYVNPINAFPPSERTCSANLSRSQSRFVF